ncbi:hypothetical protein [Streptomyces umbrinus]|uniref:hypothetical protein n=1 Tax=Streptomyces umbrinus TaxID=67370 RepID=UPI00343CAC55
MSSLSGLAIVAGVLASGVPLGLWACRREPGPLARLRMARGQGWRYLAHRAGLLLSPGLLYRGVPFGTARQRRRYADRALLRLARAACPTPAQCPTCSALTERAGVRPAMNNSRTDAAQELAYVVGKDRADQLLDAYAATVLQGAARKQLNASHPRCDCCLDAAARLDEQAAEAHPSPRLDQYQEAGR